MSRNLLQLKVILASVASLAVVGCADYFSGYNLRFIVFYFIPVSLCAWYLDRWPVAGIALLGGVSWGLVDKWSGHTYSSTFYWYWNVTIQFGALLILGLILQRLRFNLKEQRRAREELERVLEQLKQSGSEIQKLQSRLQVVCAWTHRIRVEGRWLTMEEFLARQLGLKLTHGASPEAFEQFVKSLEAQKPPPAL